MSSTIAHISDVHFGTITDPLIVDALVGEIHSSSPSLVVLSGDLTQRARSSQFLEAAAFLKRFELPTLVVPGNHDVPLWDVFRRFFHSLHNYKRFITTELRPVFRNEQMVVVGLNTTRAFTPRRGGFWKDGGVTVEQARHAVGHFEDLSDDVTRIIVTHHPFLAPSGRSNDEVIHGASRALRIFEEAGVDLLLAGHLHASYRGDPRGVQPSTNSVPTPQAAVVERRAMLSVQAGTATSGRVRSETNAYNLITIDRRTIEVEVRRWDGQHFAPEKTIVAK